MADYMYLMAKLPYIGSFPQGILPPVNIDDYKEFSKTKRSKKRIQYESFISELEEEVLKLRKGENHLPKLLSAHLITANPLDREIVLLKIKWQFLEQMNPNEPNNDWLWIYREKVEIIKRLQLFEMEKGRKNYTAIIEEVRKNASQ